MNKTNFLERGLVLAAVVLSLGTAMTGCDKPAETERSASAPVASGTAPASGVKGIPSTVPPAQRAQYEQQAAHEQARAAARAAAQK